MAIEAQSQTATRTVISVPSVLLVFLLLAAASYGALIWAPTENTMGLVQRIFYFHVSSAWSGFVSFILVFIGSVAYLRTRALKWDWLSVASAEVGVAFFTIVLVTGPIWAKPVWGIWWTWDARLTSSFLLWVLFVSYLVLRTLVCPGHSPGVFLDLVVSDAASAARNRRRGIAGRPHGLGAAVDLGCDAWRNDGSDPLEVSIGSVALGSGRLSDGDRAKWPLIGTRNHCFDC